MKRYYASLDDSPYSKWLIKLWMYIGQEDLHPFFQEAEAKHMYIGVRSEVDMTTQEEYNTSMLTLVDIYHF